MTLYLTHFVSAADYSIASRITTWRRFERQYTVGSSSCRFQPRMENLWSLSPRRVTVYCVIGGVWLILIPTFSSSSQRWGFLLWYFTSQPVNLTNCDPNVELWSHVSPLSKKKWSHVSHHIHMSCDIWVPFRWSSTSWAWQVRF